MRIRPRGFTLIELLVVLAVIGVLVSITLPAVQQARESARRAQCRSQLRQLALALHNYHEVHRVLPAGAIVRGPAFPVLSGWGWGAMILPYVDQSPLYSSLDFHMGTAVGANELRVKTTVPLWRCPTDTADETILVSTWSGAVVPSATGNFCGVESMLSGMSAVRFAHVTDGLSQTLLLGERVTIPPSISSVPFTSGWYGILASQTSYVFSSMPYTQAAAVFPINSAMGSPQNFSSRHVGGAHFALGDGSVRYVSDHIDGGLFEALGTRNGQEVVEF